MTKEIAEDINAYASVDGPYGEGMPGNMSGQTDIEIQFFSYPILQRTPFWERVLDIRWAYNDC